MIYFVPWWAVIIWFLLSLPFLFIEERPEQGNNFAAFLLSLLLSPPLTYALLRSWDRVEEPREAGETAELPEPRQPGDG